jgi:hypothetical protein
MSGSRVRRTRSRNSIKIYCNLSPNAIAHAQRFHSHGAAGATFLWRGHTSRAACHLHAIAASSWSSVGTFQLASLRSRPLSACWYVIGRKRTCARVLHRKEILTLGLSCCAEHTHLRPHPRESTTFLQRHPPSPHPRLGSVALTASTFHPQLALTPSSPPTNPSLSSLPNIQHKHRNMCMCWRIRPVSLHC